MALESKINIKMCTASDTQMVIVCIIEHLIKPKLCLPYCTDDMTRPVSSRLATTHYLLISEPRHTATEQLEVRTNGAPELDQHENVYSVRQSNERCLLIKPTLYD